MLTLNEPATLDKLDGILKEIAGSLTTLAADHDNAHVAITFAVIAMVQGLRDITSLGDLECVLADVLEDGSWLQGYLKDVARHIERLEAIKGQAKIIAESNLRREGEANLWSPRLIKKYLRKYDLGPGKTDGYGRAKYRYRVSDVGKARMELLNGEPRDPQTGRFLDPMLDFLSCEGGL